MPRDGKGKAFGIGDTLEVIAEGHKHFGRQFTVGGFVVSNWSMDQAKIEQLSKDFYAGLHVYNYVTAYWHEVKLVKKNKDLHRDADVAEHTDQCYADVAQKDGLEIPVEREAVQQMSIRALADKAVWGLGPN
jgi:hypothetical protein